MPPAGQVLVCYEFQDEIQNIQNGFVFNLIDWSIRLHKPLYVKYYVYHKDVAKRLNSKI